MLIYGKMGKMRSLISPKKCINFLNCLKNILEIRFSLQISKSRRYFSTFFQVTSVTLYSKCPFLMLINYQDERKRRLLRLEFADRRILRRWKGYRCCQDAPSCPCCQDEPFCSCLKAKIVFFLNLHI